MTKTFLRQLSERAFKTMIQSAIAVFAAGSFDWFHPDWQASIGIVLTSTVASILTSLASLHFGPPDSPSLVETAPKA